MSVISKNNFFLPLGQVFRKVKVIDMALDKYQKEMFKVKVTSALSQLLNVLSAITSAYIVGVLIKGALLEEQWSVVLLLLAFSAGHFLLTNLNSYWSHAVAFQALVDMRKALYIKLDSLAPAYIIDRRSGDLARSALSDVNLLELYIAHTLPEFLQAAIVTPIALIIIGWFHWSLMLVLAPFLIASATVPDWLSKKAEQQGRGLRSTAGEMSADVIDSIQGLREIVVFGAKQVALKKLDTSQKIYSEAYVSYESRSGFEKGIADLLLSTGMLAIVTLGAWLVVSNNMDVTLYPAATLLAAMAFMPIMRLMAIARDLNQTAAAAERVFSIMNEEPTITDRVLEAPKIQYPPEIIYEDVRFRYSSGLPLVLDEVSFKVPAGKTVALVGPSGAGKSTCTYLLLRLWDTISGDVRIDGHGVRDFPQEKLRDLIAYVPQDTYIFNISVKENIRIGRGDATDREVFEAAFRAHALDFIEALPDKWNTILGEKGSTLSGGQRQRISIARALLKNAPILIMDEAVSSLDTESEVAVRRAMSEVSRNRTTIIVAHRPSTIRSADIVVMLNKGHVLEYGKYDELVREGGNFENLIAGRSAEMVLVSAKI